MSSGGFNDRPGGSGAPQYGQPYGSGAPQYGQPYGSGAPQYGQPYAPPPQQYGMVGRRTNPLAIASLCCGVAQVFAGPLSGIPAIVLGFMAIGQIRQTGEDGEGMATVGVVLGIIGTVLAVLAVIFFIVSWQYFWSHQPGS
jgi:Domain of unknown function (DUF4190)